VLAAPGQGLSFMASGETRYHMALTPGTDAHCSSLKAGGQWGTAEWDTEDLNCTLIGFH
jgi:hypothetical protein